MYTQHTIDAGGRRDAGFCPIREVEIAPISGIGHHQSQFLLPGEIQIDDTTWLTREHRSVVEKFFAIGMHLKGHRTAAGVVYAYHAQEPAVLAIERKPHVAGGVAADPVREGFAGNAERFLTRGEVVSRRSDWLLDGASHCRF